MAAETTIIQEQLNKSNSNFEARVEEELKECQGVKSELLENVSRLEGEDMAHQLELDAGGQALVNQTGELEAELKKKENLINRMKA